jgi:hypothetical protein
LLFTAIVVPESREVTLFRRNAEGNFVLYDFTGTAALKLQSLDCDVTQAELFDGL